MRCRKGLSCWCQVKLSSAAQQKRDGQLVQSQKLGHWVAGCGRVPRCCYMCRKDSSHSDCGANQSWVPDGWKKAELSWSTARGTFCSTWGGVCESHSGHYPCQATVPHHGTPRYERAPWCSYGHRIFHVWSRTHFHLHDRSIEDSPIDAQFTQILSENCRLNGPNFPPPSCVEVLKDYVTHIYKVRRLHLIVVDLWRPWRYNAGARQITDHL